MWEIAPFVGYAVLLCVGAAWDAATLTIPNWVSGALACLFFVAALSSGLSGGTIGLHVVFGFGVLVAGFFLFQAGLFGGGDAKLLAAAAIWTGPEAFLTLLVLMAIAGGVLAGVLLVARSRVPFIAGAPQFVNRLLEPKGGIPYGLAIMAGGIVALPEIPGAPHALTLL